MTLADRFGAWLASLVLARRIRKRQRDLANLHAKMEQAGIGYLIPKTTEELIYGDKLERRKESV